MIGKKSYFPDSVDVGLTTPDGKSEFSYTVKGKNLRQMTFQMLVYSGLLGLLNVLLVVVYSGDAGDHLPAAGFWGMLLLGILIWIATVGIVLLRAYRAHNLLEGFAQVGPFDADTTTTYEIKPIGKVASKESENKTYLSRNATVEHFTRTYVFVATASFLTVVMALTLGWSIGDFVLMAIFGGIGASILNQTEYRKGIPYTHVIHNLEKDGCSWFMEGDERRRFVSVVRSAE